MKKRCKSINPRLFSSLERIAKEGFQNAARGFSGMLGRSLSVISPNVCTVPLVEIPNVLGGPENEAVGIYLRVEGDLNAQVMLIIPLEQAHLMVDMLLDLPSHTTQKLGSLERSALAEVGNLTGSFFLNALADFAKVSLRPTPPAVMVDMVGAIMDVIVATMGDVSQEVLMFQAKFMCGERETNADFWVIPDIETLDKLVYFESMENE